MPPQILLIEEQERARLAYADLLQAEGYGVVAVATPGEALTLLNSRSFDLVLLGLPSLESGPVEGARALFTRAQSPRTPIVVVTSLERPFESPAPIPLSMVRTFIYRPCRPSTFLEGVRTALRSPRRAE